ncbi:MAG: T9SS type A sorting domain-containing protein [Saprospiraceae bacterium]
MKYLSIIIGLFVFVVFGNTQTCDIYTLGFKSIPNEIISGESVDLVFSVKNDAKGVQCEYAARSVQVYLFLPESGLIYENIIYPTEGKGAYFDWQYDIQNKTLVGLNHAAILDGQGEENITVRLRAKALNVAVETKTVGLSILQYFDGKVFPSNDPSNDNSLLSLRIKSNISQQEVQLDGVNSDCNVIDLTLFANVDQEVNQIDIQRSNSNNEITLVSTQKILSGNQKVNISFTDNKNLEDGESYTYSVILRSTNNTQKILKTVTVENDCMMNGSGFNIFPNPALDKIFIKLKGNLQNESVTVKITGNKGEHIKTVKNINNINNDVRLDDLTSGIYFIQILGQDVIPSKKFIKI